MTRPGRPSRLHALAPPPPPRRHVPDGHDAAHVAIGVVLGAVAAIAGTMLSRADGRDLERALGVLAPAPALAGGVASLASGSPATGSSGAQERAVPAGGTAAERLSRGGRPSIESPGTDLALARHGARIAGSSRGWGGGARPDELLDGRRRYDDWAHGLAFGGGTGHWAGEACGERFVEIELEGAARVARVVVWHHGREHMPAVSDARIEVLDGDVWRTAASRGAVAVYAGTSEPDAWWAGWSTPVEHRIEPVVTRRVRYVADNCAVEHGWLYEVEIYGA